MSSWIQPTDEKQPGEIYGKVLMMSPESPCFEARN